MSDHTPWAFLASAPAQSQIAHQSLGPLAALARDVTVTDIFVLGDGRVFADRGSGAVLVSTLHLVSVAQQVQQVANLAALAASDTAIGVISGEPCSTARMVATHHSFALTSCELDGSRARVSVEVTLWGVRVSRRADAAPEPSAIWMGETPSR